MNSIDYNYQHNISNSMSMASTQEMLNETMCRMAIIPSKREELVYFTNSNHLHLKLEYKDYRIIEILMGNSSNNFKANANLCKDLIRSLDGLKVWQYEDLIMRASNEDYFNCILDIGSEANMIFTVYFWSTKAMSIANRACQRGYSPKTISRFISQGPLNYIELIHNSFYSWNISLIEYLIINYLGDNQMHIIIQAAQCGSYKIFEKVLELTKIKKYDLVQTSIESNGEIIDMFTHIKNICQRDLNGEMIKILNNYV